VLVVGVAVEKQLQLQQRLTEQIKLEIFKSIKTKTILQQLLQQVLLMK